MANWRCNAIANPEDCGWPFCGCDPAADKVLAAIQEHHMAVVPITPTDAMIEAAKYHWGPWIDAERTQRAGFYDDKGGEREAAVWARMIEALLPAENSASVLAAKPTEGTETRDELKALSQRIEELTAERDEAERKIGEAREAFLAMIADASRWDEDVDGDTDGEGGTVITVCYHLTTGRHQLEELVAALGIPMAFDEGAGDAIQRALEATP